MTEKIPTRKIRHIANHAINLALKDELDKEILLMQRGENVASNQRRKNMIGNYLLAKPYKIIREFYKTKMISPPIPKNYTESQKTENSQFHNDIIRQSTPIKTVSNTDIVFEHNFKKEPAPHISDSDIQKIAAKAISQIERKMRTNNERIGRW